MAEHSTDVLIVGNGLGAAAAAMQIVRTSASITMFTGAGKSRSIEIDGGLISPRSLSHAFGESTSAPIHNVGGEYVFRRDELETWAIRKLAYRVNLVTDREEKSVYPHDSGRMTLHPFDERDIWRAKLIVLTEGANPKIGIAARLRPDFEPVDMIHYGRAIVQGVNATAYRSGSWRTSWGMPAGYQIIPQPNGAAIVAVHARIENIMRGGRNSRDALADLLASDFAHELGVTGEHSPPGMELVPLRPQSGLGLYAKANMLISPDAMGAIDAREPDRWDATIMTGAELGGMIVREWPNLIEWDEMGASLMRVFRTDRTPYHDDSTTGFIEEGPGPKRGLFARLLNCG